MNSSTQCRNISYLAASVDFCNFLAITDTLKSRNRSIIAHLYPPGFPLYLDSFSEISFVTIVCDFEVISKFMKMLDTRNRVILSSFLP